MIRTVPALWCPLCGREGRIVYEGLADRLYQVEGLWNFLRCAQCDVFWLHPRPVSDDIPKCYPNEYFTHEPPTSISLGASDFKRRFRALCLNTSFGYPADRKPGKPVRWLVRTAMLLPPVHKKVTMGLGPMLLPYREGGRLLDVGCGNGAYLALMKQLGWDVAGVEIDPKAAEIARKHLSIPVYVGSLANAPFAEGYFDAVTMSHVIEHVEDPVGFVLQAARYLKRGGWLVIVTPNAASLGMRMFGKHWYALQPPQHLTLFTPKSLEMCIQRTEAFRHIKVFTLSRMARKIFRKFVLVRRTGQFRHPMEEKVWQDWRVRSGSWLFEKFEELGSPVFRWGEEIGCVAVKA